MTKRHTHQLAICHECDGGLQRHLDGWPVCPHCDGRGYYERCQVCGEPMGNARRKWKRERDRTPSSDPTL